MPKTDKELTAEIVTAWLGSTGSANASRPDPKFIATAISIIHSEISKLSDNN